MSVLSHDCVLGSSLEAEVHGRGSQAPLYTEMVPHPSFVEIGVTLPR